MLMIKIVGEEISYKLLPMTFRPRIDSWGDRPWEKAPLLFPTRGSPRSGARSSGTTQGGGNLVMAKNTARGFRYKKARTHFHQKPTPTELERLKVSHVR